MIDGVLERLDPEGYASLYRLIKEWPLVVGETIARRTEICSLKFHTAVIKCSTAMWLQELSMMKRQILAKLQDRLHNDSVRQIRFVKGTLSRRPEIRAAAPRRSMRKAVAVPEMKDPELRRALESLIEAWGRAAR
jgi:predicted nucleic acid-binding Zn ribbon protein